MSNNDKFKIFDSLIQNAYFKHCSRKTKLIASPEVSKPWITASLRRCINREHKLHKESLNNPLLQDEYKRYRNTFRNSINTTKKTYKHNLLETASDMKTTWRRINSLLHLNRSNPQLKLKANDDIITDSSTIASKFNTHFAEVAHSHDTNIPRLPDDPAASIHASSNSFVFSKIDAEELYKIILCFKSKGSLLN